IVDQRKEVSGETTLSIQLVENLQRTDLSPLERSQAIGVLSENYKLSVREIAAKLGISKSNVQRSLEILSLPDDLLNALKEGASESKILLLAKIEDPEVRAAYLKDLDVLTRSQLRDEMVKGKNAKIAGSVGKGALSAEDQRISDEIQRALGLKVRLIRNSPGSEGGKLSIDFYSSSDLQELFRKLVSAS
ncbi:MAG: ParB/RepB/Spo0J family partition protein, partial [SAR324 cluster bacterium]|nr:ParB/RepB/Spo0J family partition protein [SAR324 cluster bacterium]